MDPKILDKLHMNSDVGWNPPEKNKNNEFSL